jgi:hypothetical protein
MNLFVIFFGSVCSRMYVCMMVLYMSEKNVFSNMCVLMYTFQSDKKPTRTYLTLNNHSLLIYM